MKLLEFLNDDLKTLNSGFSVVNCTAQDPNTVNGCGGCEEYCSYQLASFAGNTPTCPETPCTSSSCKCQPGLYRDDISGSGECVVLKQCIAESSTIAPTTSTPGTWFFLFSKSSIYELPYAKP